LNETEVFKLTLNKQATRIANLTLDLDLAHTQIELLTKELNELKKPTESPEE
jgi:hypothetical protein